MSPYMTPNAYIFKSSGCAEYVILVGSCANTLFMSSQYPDYSISPVGPAYVPVCICVAGVRLAFYLLRGPIFVMSYSLRAGRNIRLVLY